MVDGHVAVPQNRIVTRQTAYIDGYVAVSATDEIAIQPLTAMGRLERGVFNTVVQIETFTLKLWLWVHIGTGCVVCDRIGNLVDVYVNVNREDFLPGFRWGRRCNEI
jgi:hypothetical protein